MKNLKKRALSWLLALALVLGMVPATVLPRAEAVKFPTGTLEIDSTTGKYKVTFTAATSFENAGNWVLLIAPNVTLAKDTQETKRRLSELYVGKTLTTKDEMEGLVAGDILPSSTYFVDGGDAKTDGTTTDGKTTITFTGTLKGYADTVAALQPEGGTSYTSDDLTNGVPYVAIIYANQGQTGEELDLSHTTGTLLPPEEKKEAVLAKTGDIATSVTSNAIAANGEVGKTGITISDANAVLGDITVSLVNVSGVKLEEIKNNAITVTGKIVDGDGNAVADAGTLSVGGTYSLVLTTDKQIAAGIMPLTGTVTINYATADDQDAAVKQEVVYVSVTPNLAASAYITVAPVTFTFSEGASTAATKTGGTITITEGTALKKPFVRQAGTAAVTSAGGYVTIPAVGTTNQSYGGDGDPTAIEMQLTEAGAKLTAGTYSDSILVGGYMHTSTGTLNTNAPRTYTVPITIIVTPAVAVEYTVKYDPNGGVGTAYSETGTALTVRDNTDGNIGFTKNGYTFDGWADAATSGTSYAVGASITSSVTLYAQWKENEYGLDFELDGGTGSSYVDDASVFAGDNIDLSTPPTKTGYTFDGWAVKDDKTTFTTDLANTVTGTTISSLYSSTTLPPTGTTVTLTAKWKAVAVDNVEVILVLNGATTASANLKGKTVSLDGTSTVLTESADATYTASGISAGTHTIWIDGAATTFTVEVPTSGVGKASVPYWSLTVNTAGKGTATGGSSGFYLDGTPLSVGVTANAGYRFVQWNDKVSGGSLVSDQNPYGFDINAQTLLVAVYEEVYTAKFNLDGGNGGPTNPQTVVADKAIALTAPTKTGYTFAGWMVTDDKSTSGLPTSAITSASTDANTLYNVGSGGTLPAAGTEITFTAQWKKVNPDDPSSATATVVYATPNASVSWGGSAPASTASTVGDSYRYEVSVDGGSTWGSSKTLNYVTLAWNNGWTLSTTGTDQVPDTDIVFKVRAVSVTHSEPSAGESTVTVKVEKAPVVIKESTLEITGEVAGNNAALTNLANGATVEAPMPNGGTPITNVTGASGNVLIGNWAIDTSHKFETGTSKTVTVTFTPDGESAKYYTFDDAPAPYSAEGSYTVTVNVKDDTGVDADHSVFGNATVKLEGTSDSGVSVSRTGVALTSGVAAFGSVPAGTYTVTVDSQTAVPDATATIKVTNGIVTHDFQYWTLTYGVNGSSGSTVSVTAGGSTASSNTYYPNGTVLGWTASPASGYRFEKWTSDTGGATTVATAPAALTGTTTLYGNFVANKVEVTVKLDGTGVRGGLTNVYLAPSAGGNKIGPLTETGNNTGVYTTSVVADGTYRVYVGDEDTGVDVKVENHGDGKGEVNYYTVNYFENVIVNNQGKKVTNVMITPDGTGTFNSALVDTLSALSAVYKGTSNTVANGTIVLSGTEVTFALSSNATSKWGSNDYALTWTKGGSALGSAGDLTHTLKYDTAHGQVAAKLTLNLYDVTIHHQAGHLGSLSLTDTYTTSPGGNNFSTTSFSGTWATFTGVPAGKYTLSATPYGDDQSVVGYNITQNNTVTDNTTHTPEVAASGTATMTVDGDETAAVVTEGATYTIQLSDVTNPQTGDFSADNTDLESAWDPELTYGYSDAVTKTVTIKNTGNRTLYDLTVTNGNGGVFLLNSADDTTGETSVDWDSLDPGKTVTFKVTFPKDQIANTAGHTDTFTVTAKKTDGGAAAWTSGVNYSPTQVVKRAPITAAAVTDIVVPVADEAPDTDDVTVKATGSGATASDPLTYTAHSVDWGSVSTFAAGTEYTAEVVLKADSNHYFVTSDTDYTIMGAANTGTGTYNGKASVVTSKTTVDGDTLTLKYTFPPTKPTGSVTLTAEDWYKATATPSGHPTSNVNVYYALIPTDELDDTVKAGITAAAIKGGYLLSSGGSGTGITTGGNWTYAKGDGGSAHEVTFGGDPASADDLKPYTSYTVYAVVEVTGAVTGVAVLSDVLEPADDVTFRKVTVKVADGQNGVGHVRATVKDANNSTRVSVGTYDNDDNTLVVGVDVGETLTVEANLDTGVTTWKFKEWDAARASTATSDSANTLTNGNQAVATWKPVEDADPAANTAAEIVLTATFEAGYKVTYHANYDSSTASVTDDGPYYDSGSVTTKTASEVSGTISRKGYTLTGWSAKTDGSDAVTPGASIDVAAIQGVQGTTAGGALNLYAVWTPIQVQVSNVGDIKATYATKIEDTAALYPVVPDTSYTGATYSYAFTGESYGFEIKGDTGAITGRPTITTDAYKGLDGNSAATWVPLKVKVTDTINGSHVTVEVRAYIDKLTVRPTATYPAAATPTPGAYYAGNTVNKSGITATVTAPYWDITANEGAGGWVETNAREPHKIGGTWYFGKGNSELEDQSLTAGTNVPYDVNFDITPVEAGTVNARSDDNNLYVVEDTTVEITAETKSYSFKLVEVNNKENAASGDFGEGYYIKGAPDTVQFKIYNTGNQELTFNSFVLTDGATSEFNAPAITDNAGQAATAPITVAGGAVSAETFTMTLKDYTALTKGTYTDTLTVTDTESKATAQTLDLKYVVKPLGITKAAVSDFEAAAPGGTPVDSVTRGDYTLYDNTTGNFQTDGGKDKNQVIPYTASIVWKDGAGNTVTSASAFKAGTDYTATVTLTANENYYFVAGADAAANQANYTLTDPDSATPGVSVASQPSLGGGSVTFTVTYEAEDLAVPTVYPWATATDTGRAVIKDNNGADAGTKVKYIRNTDETADPEDVWTNGSDYTVPVDFTNLTPGTTYYVHAVAGITVDGTAVLSEVKSVPFRTPYLVQVTTDTNGTATVDNDTANKTTDGTTPVKVPLYAETGHNTTNQQAASDAGESVIAFATEIELDTAPDDAGKYAFDAWVGGAVTGTGAGNAATGTDDKYTPSDGDDSDNDGVIELEATFEKLYTIRFHPNGGTDGAVNPTEINGVKLGDKKNLPTPSPVYKKSGYKSTDHWTLYANGTGTKVAFGGELELTTDETALADDNHVIVFYHGWESLTLDIEPQELKAVYNMAQDDWNGNGAPTAGVKVINGSGDPSNYSFSMSVVSGANSPLNFLEIDRDTGVIRLQTDKRMGNAGTYKFNVTVNDAGKGMSATKEFILVVDKAKPILKPGTEFKYTAAYADDTGYLNDHVVSSGTITATVVDPYLQTKILHDTINAPNVTNKGVWTSTPTTFTQADSQDYKFTFTVTDNVDKNNYYTLDQTAALKAVEKNPNIGVQDVDDSTQYVSSTTLEDRATYGYTATDKGSPITVSIKNTGTADFTSVTVTPSDSTVTVTPVDGWNPSNGLTNGNTASFTFVPPVGKEVDDSVYTVTFTVKGTTEENKSATATYVYKLTVEPKEIDHAVLTGLTPPAVNDALIPDTDVVKSDSDSNHSALYNASAVTWSGSDGSTPAAAGDFKPGVSYTATFTLSPVSNNYIFVAADTLEEPNTCPGYSLDGVESSTGGGGKDDPTNGGKVAHLVKADGTVVITHTYDALPLSVVGTLTPVDYDTAKIESIVAKSAVNAKLYYVVFETAQTDITAAEIKAAALSGTHKGTAAVAGSYGSTAGIEPDVNDEVKLPAAIEIDGLTGGETYYLYVAAQPTAEAQSGTNVGLAEDDDDATLGKHLVLDIASLVGTVTQITAPDGTVSWSTDTDGDGNASNNSLTSTGGAVDAVNLTMKGDDTFTPTVTDNDKFGFSKWTVNSVKDTATGTGNYGYKYDDHEKGTTLTLTATFYRKISGEFKIGGDLTEGSTLSADVSENKLYVGNVPQTKELMSSNSTDLSYQWQRSTDSGWADISGATGATYTVQAADAGKQLKLVITYTDHVNDDPATSSVEAVTGTITLQLDKPIPDLVISETGNGDSSASDTKTDEGGLYLSFPKIRQDTGPQESGNVVKQYKIVLKDSNGSVLDTIFKDAIGDDTYTHHWPASKTGIVITPGAEYEVEVTAIANTGKGYSDSETGEDRAKAGFKTLKVSDLTFKLVNKTFNGAEQNGEGSVTAPDGAGAVTVVYADYTKDNAGVNEESTKLHVNINANATTVDTDKKAYDVYVSVAQGTLYLALAKTEVPIASRNVDTEADNEWQITQAPTTLTVSGGSVKKDFDIDLAVAAAAKVTYNGANGSNPGSTDDKYERGGVITHHFDLGYTVAYVTPKDGVKRAAVAGTDYTISGTTFTPKIEGTFEVTVSATYDTDGTDDDQFQADLAEPVAVPMSIVVSERTITDITLEKNTATNYVTYGEPNGTYMKTDDEEGNDGALQMDRNGLKITITYDTGAPDVYIVDTDTLPTGLTWNYDDTSIADGDTDFHIKFKTDGTVHLDVSYGGMTSDDNVPFTLDPATWTVNVDTPDMDPDNKVYGGSVQINGKDAIADESAWTTITLPDTTSVTVTAVAKEGYEFDRWVIVYEDENGEKQQVEAADGAAYGSFDNATSPTATFTPAKNNMTARAIFQKEAAYSMTFKDNRTPEQLADGDFKRIITATYLDALGSHTVTLTNTGDALTNVTLSAAVIKATRLDGGDASVNFDYSNMLTVTPIATFAKNGEQPFVLDLSNIKYAGEYELKITATGKDGNNNDVTAYYTITITIDPKVIDRADVLLDQPGAPGDTLDTVPDITLWDDKDTVDPGDDTILAGPDVNGVTPVAPTVTWTEGGIPVPGNKVDADGGSYDVKVELTANPNYIFKDEDVDEHKLNGETNGTGDLNVYVFEPDVLVYETTSTVSLKPVLKFDDETNAGVKDGPEVDLVHDTIHVTRGGSLSGTVITVNLGAYANTVYDVTVVPTTNDLTGKGATLTANSTTFDPLNHTDPTSSLTYTVDLSTFDTSAVGSYALVLTAKGASVDNSGVLDTVATYTLTIKVNAPYVPTPTPPAEEEVCPFHVFYWVGLHGVTDMPTAETVEEGATPVAVPNVMANTGYEFKGWSLTKPVEGEEPVLVDPATVPITEDTVFYAVYEELEVVPTTIFHEHYVIGYPDGTFGPADDITRGSVATIIARAILPGFVEGADYGNPGGYLDVEGHWAESAIAYCSIYGVFKGYDDGNFYADKPITRQEFALVIARLNGVQPNQGVPFTDIEDAAFWAMDGIYTSYANGWFNGYLDSTFKPLNNIARSEAVKVFNAYLKRGVDAEGLSEMTEYVHSGTASNNTENGINQYMTWPDVPETYWAYYEIIEAANDHEFHYTGENFDQLPEHWTKCWIDEVWRYHDDPDDGGPAAN